METYGDCITPNDENVRGDTDSQSIQRAIRTAKALGVNTVRIPRINARTGEPVWNIDRAVLLPSDITVLLDSCRLRLTDGVYENIFRNENLYTDVSLSPDGEQRRIRLIGIGDAVLDGGRYNDLRESTSGKDGRPPVRANNLILLHNVAEYSVENITCVNMRYWAINQLFCHHGRLERIRFRNGEKIPNQDGINLRIGCHHITVENITGRTGDDTVALTALPLCGDRTLAVEGLSPDIHDVLVRGVHAHTAQTVVALRNQDGAKIYNVEIEDIEDTGGEYYPWGVVRIGENGYFRERLSRLGETRNIRVRSVTSRFGGTVMLGASLMDSEISDISATEGAFHAVSTFRLTNTPQRDTSRNFGGIEMENVTFTHIRYLAKPFFHTDIPETKPNRFTYPDQPFSGAALDFRHMEHCKIMKNVVFRDVYACSGAETAVTGGIPLDIRN